MVLEFLQTESGKLLILIAVLVWQLPWKGVALWKAARRKEVFWFVILFLVNTLAILEIFYIFYVTRDKKRWIENKLNGNKNKKRKKRK